MEERIKKLTSLKGKRTVDSFHRQLGLLMRNACGMSRTESGLQKAIEEIPAIEEEFWSNAIVVGESGDYNQGLEKACRVADFLEFAPLMCRDALQRNESCGGHFREEFQTEDGEAKRNDDDYAYVAVWYPDEQGKPQLAKEPLRFENLPLMTRSYK